MRNPSYSELEVYVRPSLRTGEVLELGKNVIVMEARLRHCPFNDGPSIQWECHPCRQSVLSPMSPVRTQKNT